MSFSEINSENGIAVIITGNIAYTKIHESIKPIKP